VANKRQKPISKKNLEKWVTLSPSDFCLSKEALENYERNKNLIDLDCIPEHLAVEIVSYYKALNNSEKKVPLEYFQQHQLTKLMEEFVFRNTQPQFNLN
jgi:hypothetical protein